MCECALCTRQFQNSICHSSIARGHIAAVSAAEYNMEISTKRTKLVQLPPPPWPCGPSWSMASSFLRILDYTKRRTTVGRAPLDEWSARRRDPYLRAHNTHDKHPYPDGVQTHNFGRRAAAELRIVQLRSLNLRVEQATKREDCSKMTKRYIGRYTVT